MNKTQTIVGEDRGTHQFFIENSKFSQYAWNSASIDDTEVSRCLAAVVQHFKFPVDVDLNAAPSVNCNDQSTLYTYLRNLSNNPHFVVSVLQVLIEERRSAHRSRWSTDREAKYFKLMMW